MKRMVTFAIALGVGVTIMGGCVSVQAMAQTPGFITTADKVADQKKDTGKDEKAAADKNTAVAEKEPEYKKTDAEWKFARTGFSIKVPDCIKNLKGHLKVDDIGHAYVDDEVYEAGIIYEAATDEEAEKKDAAIDAILNSKKPDEEKMDKIGEEYFAKGSAPICQIIAYKDNLKFDDVMKKLDQKKENFSEIKEIGEKGSFKYVFLVNDKAKYQEGIQKMTEEYKADVDKLFAEADSIVADITLTGPQI